MNVNARIPQNFSSSTNSGNKIIGGKQIETDLQVNNATRCYAHIYVRHNNGTLEHIKDTKEEPNRTIILNEKGETIYDSGKKIITHF